MADSKISALTAIGSLAAEDLLAVVDDPAGTPVTKKATVQQVVDAVASLGGGATPGGSDTQVQFNDGGALGGDTGLVFNKTTNVLSCTGGYYSGASPSTFGTHRFTNNEFLWWRGGGANYQVLGLDASDVIWLGGSGGDIRIDASSSGEVRFVAQEVVFEALAWVLGDDVDVDPSLTTGAGAPVDAKPNGSIFLRTDGDATTGLYTRQGGAWEAVGGGSTSFADNVFRVTDNGDATKILAFECSGISTGTTRTLTVPNASTTIVGTDTTQTLTNKTLTTPTIAAVVSGGGTSTFPTSTDTLVNTSGTQSLSNKTIVSPAVTGTATYTNGKTTITAKSGEHQTTTATTAAVAAVTTTIADNTTATVDFIAIMRATGATAKAGRWAGRVTYYRNGGAPVLVGSATYDTAVETTAGDDVAFNLSTNDLQIQVTSADADDRNWSIEARVQTVTNAA